MSQPFKYLIVIIGMLTLLTLSSGVIMPSLISTNKLPVSAIIILLAGFTGLIVGILMLGINFLKK